MTETEPRTRAGVTTAIGSLGPVVAVSLAPGEQLIDGITAACLEHGIRAATISSAVGTISEIYLRNPRDITSLPIHHEHEFADEIDTVVLRRPMEILSLQGNITDYEGGPWVHCHGLFSEAGGNVRGGHVFRATIWSQAEIFLQPIDGLAIDRERDLEVTGLPQIRFNAEAKG